MSRDIIPRPAALPLRGNRGLWPRVANGDAAGRGITLIELLAVTVVLGVLAILGIPLYQSTIERGYCREASDLLLATYTGERLYYSKNGTYLVPATSAQWKSLNLDNPNSEASPMVFAVDTSCGADCFLVTATFRSETWLTVNQDRAFSSPNGQCDIQTAVLPVCGDGSCNGSETCATCPGDCGACPPTCGDGSCNGSETCSTCPGDCGVCPPPPPACGDGSCNGSETCGSCPADCGACPPTCGDGSCNGSETCSTCPGDCGVCPPVCGDGSCNGSETCASCPGDCGACPPVCGDGSCNGSETCASCPGDCGACAPAPFCGDGQCQVGEDFDNCFVDCCIPAGSDTPGPCCTGSQRRADNGRCDTCYSSGQIRTEELGCCGSGWPPPVGIGEACP